MPNISILPEAVRVGNAETMYMYYTISKWSDYFQTSNVTHAASATFGVYIQYIECRSPGSHGDVGEDAVVIEEDILISRGEGASRSTTRREFKAPNHIHVAQPDPCPVKPRVWHQG